MVSNTDHGGSRIFRRSNWLCHSEHMGPIWGSVPCQKKSSLCVKWVVSGWNKGFPRENSSCEVFMVTNCPYTGISKWMEKSNIFLNNGTCGNTMVKPQTVRYRLIKQTSKFWKYSRIWKISLDSNLNCFTRYKCIVIQKDSWININEWFGCNFPTWNILNVWRARDHGHHYDVTSKCCGVTITTHLVEWTLSISEIRVFFCCFQELSSFKKYKWLPKIKCGIKAKRHGRSVLRN